MFNKFNKEDILKFCEIYIKSYDEKILLENEYSMFDLATTVFAMGRLLNQEKYPSFEQIKQSNVLIRNFLEKSYTADIKGYNLIYNYSKDYLKILKNE